MTWEGVGGGAKLGEKRLLFCNLIAILVFKKWRAQRAGWAVNIHHNVA
jgi:hypothetical protein